jgi:hypothetical protein
MKPICLGDFRIEVQRHGKNENIDLMELISILILLI